MFEKTKINEKEAEVGPFFLKKIKKSEVKCLISVMFKLTFG